MNTKDHLLQDGQTLDEWWARNGLSAERARRLRKETYDKQKLETMETMRMYNAHTASNSD